MNNVVAITIENGSASDTCYVENEQEKTFNLPVEVGDSRSLVSPVGAPFQGDLYLHFADAAKQPVSGNAIVILFKIVNTN